jgi:hypothetical protein
MSTLARYACACVHKYAQCQPRRRTPLDALRQLLLVADGVDAPGARALLVCVAYNHALLVFLCSTALRDFFAQHGRVEAAAMCFALASAPLPGRVSRVPSGGSVGVTPSALAAGESDGGLRRVGVAPSLAQVRMRESV